MHFEAAIETGPKRRKTMVHVIDLPGCIALGPTQDEALEQAKDAIRERWAFLREHGERLPDPEPVELDVVEEDLSGDYLGFAAVFFEADRPPVSREELERDLRWLAWSREALVEAAHAQPAGLTAKPGVRGRPAAAVLAHVAGAEAGYLASVVGSQPGLSAAVSAVERSPDDPWEALARARQIIVRRLEAMTDDELSRIRPDLKQPRSTRRMLRRMLEHEWEHVLELRARLAEHPAQ